MRISDWSSDVCSSDLGVAVGGDPPAGDGVDPASTVGGMETGVFGVRNQRDGIAEAVLGEGVPDGGGVCGHAVRSEEHTSELQSLMRSSYAVFCLKKKK